MGKAHLGPAEDFAVRPTVAGSPVALLSEVGGGAAPAYATGTFTLATGTFKIQVQNMTLTTTQRATLAGTARLRIT